MRESPIYLMCYRLIIKVRDSFHICTHIVTVMLSAQQTCPYPYVTFSQRNCFELDTLYKKYLVDARIKNISSAGRRDYAAELVKKIKMLREKCVCVTYSVCTGDLLKK